MSNNILGYKPAELRITAKECYVSYYAYCPQLLDLKRTRIRLNHIKNDAERKRYGNLLVRELNSKLASGWNPNMDNTRNNNIKMIASINEYLQTKAKELRPESMRSYRSLGNYLKRWITDNQLNVTPNNFESGYALRIMSVIAQDKSIRTYNNYLRWFNTFFNWLIENEYCRENPFSKIKQKREQEKTRQIIDVSWRQTIWKWMEENNEELQMACALVYYCFVRPTEITFLKPENFNLEAQTLFIPAEASKNRKSQRITIPDNAIGLMRDFFEKRNISPSHYIFSHTRTLRPGPKRMKGYYFSKRWVKMRNVLKFPEEYQLYSLKDTGIVQMLEDGVPPNEVMIQARHSDLGVTTAYLKHTSTGNSQYNVRTKTTKFAENRNR